jgi:MFS family permease
VLILPLIIFGLRFCGQGMIFHLAMVSAARWFAVNRGKAVSISVLGFNIGEAGLPIVVVALLTLLTWQQVWIATAVFSVLLIPILMVLLATERAPQTQTSAEENTGLFGRHWTRGEVLKHWLFWCIIPLVFAPSIFGRALFFQQVHLAETEGWGHARFVTLFPLYTGVSVLCALGFGLLADRIGTIRLLPYYQLPFALGFILIATIGSFPSAILAMVFMAITAGGNSTLLTVFWADIYGTRHIGSEKRLRVAFTVAGSAIGPWITGSLIDAGLNFSAQMPYYAGAIVAGCLLAFYACRRVERDMQPGD